MNNQEKALYAAIMNGDVTRVREIVAENPSIVNTRDSDGKTPLHAAASAWEDEADIVHFLVVSGADIQATDKDGWTAYDWADFWINRDVLLLLEGVTKISTS